MHSRTPAADQVGLGGAVDPPLLFAGHGFLWRSETRTPPPFDLDETEDASLLGHEVNLPRARTEIPREDLVARGRQLFLRNVLPSLPRAARPA